MSIHVHQRGTSCPACRSRRCPCGRRLNCPEAEQCWVCLRDARIAARRFCDCGAAIRTEHEQCSRCRRRPEVMRLCACGTEIRTELEQCFACRRSGVEADDAAARQAAAGERPFRWVQRGGIKHAVFEDVA